MREYRLANKEREKYRAQLRREEFRKQLLEEVGQSKCKDCGETDFRVLQFDHIGEKVDVIARLRSQTQMREEAHKCEVVCANCHCIRTYERRPKFPEVEGKWIRRSKTHCPQGHLMDVSNTVYYSKRRVCRICKRNQSYQSYLKRKSK